MIASFRYIGDVLLSTPVALSIRTHFPDAAVDYLVFEGTEGVLEKNPHVRDVRTVRPGSRGPGAFLSLFRKYDVAFGVNPSDRTALACIGAGKESVGFSYFRRKEWWKRRFMSTCRPYDDRMHIVPLILTLLETVGIPPVPRVVSGFDEGDGRVAREILGGGEYVLFHPYAGRNYKHWPPEHWGELARLVREGTGLEPVFTMSPSPAEGTVLERILENSPRGTRTLGRPLTFPQLAAVLSRGRAFVGVDTVVTHMAAALEVPTVAVFGPTWVHHWGPWPNGEISRVPYDPKGGIQRRGRIVVAQKDWQCVPCNRETCALTGGGRIECLATLSADEVYEELHLLLDRNPR